MLSNPAYRREAGRHAFGGAYNYIAAVSEEEFVSQALTNSLDAIAHDYPAALVGYLETRRAPASGSADLGEQCGCQVCRPRRQLSALL